MHNGTKFPTITIEVGFLSQVMCECWVELAVGRAGLTVV